MIESEQIYTLFTNIEKIVRIVNYGQIYELAYTPETILKPALENLQSIFVDLYNTFFELFADSLKLFL